jgi:phosphoglycolate phosphatase-like HAD superfamily hydrolase
VLARSPHVLLDFDAPSVRSGASTTDRAIADELRQLLAHAPLPADVADAKDPFIVLRYAAALGPRVRRQGRATVPGLEVQAIPTATTTADAHNAIRALKRTGYTITIVSNNSDTAVIKYVTAHGLREHIDGIAGRTSSDAAELKPNPALLLRAATALGSEPAQCVRIGDSVTDMQAAQATGSAAPGYANKPGKYARLLAQKPDAVIDAMSELIAAVAV